jgi:hypothetical protein
MEVLEGKRGDVRVDLILTDILMPEVCFPTRHESGASVTHWHMLMHVL